MDTNADRRARRSAPYEDAQYDADDAPALDGLVGAALAMSAAALVLAALAHTTALTLGTTTRAVAITVAIVLGAVAGWVGGPSAASPRGARGPLAPPLGALTLATTGRRRNFR